MAYDQRITKAARNSIKSVRRNAKRIGDREQQKNVRYVKMGAK